MNIFITGASGFVGSAVIAELLRAGHQVTALARSDESAKKLSDGNVKVLRGSLEDLDSLQRGAHDSEGVIHCAFIHDFANYAASAEADRKAITALGDALAGSGRPLVVTSGAMGFAVNRAIVETDAANPKAPRLTEVAALPFAEKNVRVSVVRLPPTTHGAGDHGFVPELISIAKKTGVSGFVGEGQNRWPAVHRLDAAKVFRLAVEKAPAGSRLHAVAEEGIATKDIAAVIGRKLGLPVASKPAEHFGWMGRFFSADALVSSEYTRKSLAWEPTHPGLLADLEAAYF
ncbi:MAG: SDR family oxidoreductase [Archangium sp.]